MKKAREVADKTAEEFTRQFQVQQAKDKAAQQEITNRLEKRRVDTESAYAEVAKQKADETERKNKEAEKLAEFKSKQQADHFIRQDILGDAKGIQGAVLRGRDAYLKAFPDMTPDAALNAALEDVKITRDRMVPGGQTNPPQQPAAQGNSVLSGTGNPLAAIVQQLQGPQQGGGPPLTGILPGGEPSMARQQASPVAQAALALKQEQAQHQKAAAALADAKRKTEDMLRIASEEAKKSLTSLHEAQRKHVNEETNRLKKMLGVDIQKKQAEIQHLLKEDKKIDQDIAASKAKVNRDDVKDAAEAAITGTRGLTVSEKARILSLNDQEWRGFNTESRHLEHLNLSMAAYQAAVNAPQSDTSVTQAQRAAAKAMIPILQMDIRSSESQLKDKKASYDQTSEWVAHLKLRTVNRPDGAPDHKAQKANEAATSRDAKKSARAANVQPAPVIPPGAPRPEGTQPGLYARPAPHTAVPKKKIEKKKGKVVYSEGGITIREK